MEYFILALICVFGTYQFLKRKQQKEIRKIFAYYNIDPKFIHMSNLDQLKTMKMQKELIFYISDACHNIGCDFFQKNKTLRNEEFVKKIGLFFAYTRRLSDNLYLGFYTKEQYEEILNFIKNDFHDFCHFTKEDLDLKKYYKLIDTDKYKN